MNLSESKKSPNPMVSDRNRRNPIGIRRNPTESDRSLVETLTKCSDSGQSHDDSGRNPAESKNLFFSNFLILTEFRSESPESVGINGLILRFRQIYKNALIIPIGIPSESLNSAAESKLI